jgi:hypothetical protein
MKRFRFDLRTLAVVGVLLAAVSFWTRPDRWIVRRVRLTVDSTPPVQYEPAEQADARIVQVARAVPSHRPILEPAPFPEGKVAAGRQLVFDGEIEADFNSGDTGAVLVEIVERSPDGTETTCQSAVVDVERIAADAARYHVKMQAPRSRGEYFVRIKHLRGDPAWLAAYALHVEPGP